LLYTLVFLRMRGFIEFESGRVSFRKTAILLGSRGNVDNRLLTLSKQMLLYPVAYTIIILPIAAARFSSFAGHDVPFEVTIFCDTVFLLSGVVNVTVFMMTRRILPPNSFKIPNWSTSPQPIEESIGEVGSISGNSTSYPESYEAKGPIYASDITSGSRTDFDGPINPETVYDLSDANSAILWTPVTISNTIGRKEDQRYS